MTRPEQFTAEQWDTWVQRGHALVRTKTDVQFALGEITIEMIPLQPHGFGDHGVQRLLRAYSAEIGISESTLTNYRHIVKAWPREKRNPEVSFAIHQALASHPSRFDKINEPPVDPVTGHRRWTVNEALRAAGRAPLHPVTSQERVDRVRDLVRDDDDAASAVKDILRRPTVVRQVLDDPSARHILRQADHPRFYEPSAPAEEDFHEPEPGLESSPAEGAPGTMPPAPRREAQLRYSEAPREVLALLGACTAFYTQMQRMIPDLHVTDYDADTKNTLLASIERVRAAAGWAETVINTGDTSMDDALAKLLGGES